MIQRGEEDHGIGERGDGIRRGCPKIRMGETYSVLSLWTYYLLENLRVRLQLDRRLLGQG